MKSKGQHLFCSVLFDVRVSEYYDIGGADRIRRIFLPLMGFIDESIKKGMSKLSL